MPYEDYSDKPPQDDIQVTINGQPAAAPTGAPGDIIPNDPTDVVLAPKSTQTEFWSGIEANPNFDVATVIPKQSVRLSTRGLTNMISQNPTEAVVQTLAGVIEVDGETYAVVNLHDASKGDSPRMPHAMLAKFADNPKGRPEVVGLATPEQPFEKDNDKADPRLRLEIDEHFGIHLINTGENAIQMVTPSQRTRAALTKEFGRQRLEQDFGIKSEDNIVELGSKAVSLVHESPFNNTKLWAPISADVRKAIDEREDMNGQVSLVDASEVKAGDKLNAGAVAVFGNQVSELVRGITQKQQQTPDDKLFVGQVVDMTSRIITDVLETGQLKLPHDHRSTNDFARMALKVASKSPEQVSLKSPLPKILARLTGREAIVDRDDTRLTPAAEDYAVAAVKFLAMMVRDTGQLQISAHNAGNFNQILAYRDKVLAANAEADQAA